MKSFLMILFVVTLINCTIDVENVDIEVIPVSPADWRSFYGSVGPYQAWVEPISKTNYTGIQVTTSGTSFIHAPVRVNAGDFLLDVEIDVISTIDVVAPMYRMAVYRQDLDDPLTGVCALYSSVHQRDTGSMGCKYSVQKNDSIWIEVSANQPELVVIGGRIVVSHHG